MPTLSNATLKIELVSGTTKKKVTATVNVKFDPNEETFIKLIPTIHSTIKCRIMGYDTGLNAPHDPLFWMTSKVVAKDTLVLKFQKNNVPSDDLDEDDASNAGADEIFARFSCVNNSPVLSAAVPIDSAIVVGTF